ncbi:DVU3141 family protein [Salinicola lusitanus]|uniref:DVU3141 family protein n=1 Tax=Salinicola lusitanus TaxID=1949085 RepID=A0ABZ3CPI9_9GAMM|nr:DVU3141 family protein [Salinicola lusitanus]
MGALAVTFAGCASQGHYGGNNVGTMQGAAALGPEISSFLDNATPGSISAFPKSPWGSNVSVIVQERYFAASGRLCAHLDVARQGAPQTAQRAQVACLVKDNGWYAQRLVTQVLAGSSTR